MLPLLHGHRFFLWVLVVAIATGCGSQSTSTVQFGAGLPQAPATPELSRLEQQLVARVNHDRAQKQLPPLVLDRRLSEIARSHSMDMRDNRYFEHESPRFGLLDARLARAGYLFVTSRENLAEAPTVNDAEEGLLKSPHHYENLMAEDVTHLGIGIVKGGVKDSRNLTVTQIFATPAIQESDSEALGSVERAIQKARTRQGQSALRRHPQLDQLARSQLALLSGELDTSQLKGIGLRAAEMLAQKPIVGTKRISVGAQVVVDSTQFAPQGATVDRNAKCFGIAVDHRNQSGGTSNPAPRLRVLILVGLP